MKKWMNVKKGNEGIYIMFALVAMALTLSMLFGVKVNAETYGQTRNVSECNIDYGPAAWNVGNNQNGIFEWTGEQIKPSFLIRIGKTTSSIREGQDYTVTYGENKETGKGTITITGLEQSGSGFYSWVGSKTFEFTITKATNPLINSGYNDGTNDLCGFYSNGVTLSKNIKKSIYGGYDLPTEIINSIKSNDLKFKSSNTKIFKIGKNTITGTGVGVAYLSFTIPETTHYKSFNGKMRIVSYPPRANYVKSSSKLEPGNKFRYGVTSGLGAEKSKTSFKCKVIIATSKKFTKSSIIKSYTLANSTFNKQKIKTIKSKKFKKGATFYIKTYTYKKLSNGQMMYGETDITRYKISKKGKITSKSIADKDPYIK